MKSASLARDQAYAEIVVYGVLFLFFFQLISDFVEAVYAFGLLGTSIPPEIGYVLLFFTPLLLITFQRRLPDSFVPALGLLMLVCRLVEVMLDTRGRMIVAGIGVGSFLLCFPALLWTYSSRRRETKASSIVAGLAVGVGMSVMFKALNSGIDITTVGRYPLFGWFLSAIAGLLLVGRLAKTPSQTTRFDDKSAEAGLGWMVVSLSLGLIAALVLLYFAFVSPNVIARWTGADYLFILITEILALALFALLLTRNRYLALLLRPGVIWFANIFFVISLVSTILAHQVRFPLDSAGFPLAEPQVTDLQYVPLLFMMISFPIVLVDFALFSQELMAIGASPKTLGVGFAFSSLFLLIVILAQIFTTVYAYIPLVGPFFRDKFWLVFLVPGLVILLPYLSSRLHSLELSPAPMRTFPSVILLTGVVAIAGVIETSSRPPVPAAQPSTLRVLTYNIQQGYSGEGLRNYDGQLELIRAADADVIGLQESDTNRIAGGNADVVRYFGDRLNLYSYYGPKVVAGTFGIALLSRFPLENPRTFFMYSQGEQTATIGAQIAVGGKVFNLFVTHLGNDGPIIQQEAVLREVSGRENVILMGDFNFRPNSEQYQVTTDVLNDSWSLRWPTGKDDRGLNPVDRIDHIFVSPGIIVSDVRILEGPQSDHPAVMADVDWQD